LKIIYDTEKLKKTIDDLFTLTGISLALADTNGNYLYMQTKPEDCICIREQSTPEGRARCTTDDKTLMHLAGERRESVSRVCHAGPVDTAVPILKDNVLVGFVIIGRIVTEKMDIVDAEGMTHITEAQLSSMKNLLSRIIFENAIEIEYDVLASRARELIHQELSSELSIKSLVKKLYVSKNKLYRSFHSYYGITVGEYIQKARMARAEELLRESEMPVFLISESVGIQNYTYFSRLFKKRYGISPLAYRKSISGNSEKEQE
jgi:AraC-like DNA-binding protein